MKKILTHLFGSFLVLLSCQAAALELIHVPTGVDPAFTDRLNQLSAEDLVSDLQNDTSEDIAAERRTMVKMVGAVHSVFKGFLRRGKKIRFIAPDALGSKKNLITWQPPMAIIHTHAAQDLRNKHPEEMQAYLELKLDYASQNILMVPAGDIAGAMGSKSIKEALSRIAKFEEEQGEAYFIFNPDMKAVAEIIEENGFFYIGIDVDAKGDQIVAQAALDSYYTIIGDHAFEKAARQLDPVDLKGVTKLYFEADPTMNPKFSLLLHRSQFKDQDLLKRVAEVFRVLQKKNPRPTGNRNQR